MDINCILSIDVLEQILSSLTVRQLLQLRRVCKSWCSLIDNVNFIKLHYHRQYSTLCNDAPLFCLNDGGLRVRKQYYRVDQEWDQVLDVSNDLLGDNAALFAEQPIDAFTQVHCIGAVNGIVCLQWRRNGIGLWNPATRDFKAVENWHNLPRRISGASLWFIGFGFDSTSNDFKFVTSNCFRISKVEHHYKMYSLHTNSWKNLNAPSTLVRPIGTPMHAYLDNVCYWAGFSREHTEYGRPLILSFDFVNECFEISDPPKDALPVNNNGGELYWQIIDYMESIAMIVSNIETEAGNCIVDIWVVTKFHEDSVVPSLWEHLFTIPQIPAFGLIWAHKFQKHGELILLISDMSIEELGYCSLYNPSTGTSKRLGILFNYCVGFTESMFSLSKRLGGCLVHQIGMEWNGMD